MIVSNDNLNSIRISFDARFKTAYESTVPFWSRLATEIPSGSRGNRYGWLANLARMREWVGDRVIQNVAEHEQTILNKDFEATVSVSRNDIEDDSLGIYAPQFDTLGAEAKKYPDDLIVTLLQDGEDLLCFDGQDFFDTDHPNSTLDGAAGTQQNYWSSGKALTAANYEAVRAAMMGFRGDNGRHLRVNPNLLVVPPALEGTAKRILKSAFSINTVGAAVGAGTTMESNVNEGTAEVLVVPELAGEDTTWYLLDTSKAIKPFIFQNRQGPRVERFERGSEYAFQRKAYLYGVDTRGNAGFGLWFLAAKAVA